MWLRVLGLIALLALPVAADETEPPKDGAQTDPGAARREARRARRQAKQDEEAPPAPEGTDPQPAELVPIDEPEQPPPPPPAPAPTPSPKPIRARPAEPTPKPAPNAPVPTPTPSQPPPPAPVPNAPAAAPSAPAPTPPPQRLERPAPKVRSEESRVPPPVKPPVEVVAPEPPPEPAVPQPSLRELARRYPKKEPVYFKFLDEHQALDRAILETLVLLGEDGGAERSDLHNDLGVLLLRRRFETFARREIRLAIRKDRKNHVAWFNYGLLEELAGHDWRARRRFRKCIDLRPGHSTAWFHIGLIAERAGDRDEAIRAYERAYFFEPRLLEPGFNPLVMETELIADTLAWSGPRRSLARALPMELMDGTRIQESLGGAEMGQLIGVRK